MTPTTGLLKGLAAYKVVRGVRPDTPDRVDGDHGRYQRFAAIVAAHATGTPSVLAWCRPSGDGPISVVVGGGVADLVGAGPALDGEQPLALPAGGRGRPVPAGGLPGVLDAFPHWVTLDLVHDAMALHGTDDDRRDPIRPCLEDGLLSVWHGPFAWLIVAEPIDTTELVDLAAQAAAAERAAQSRAGSSPAATVEAHRSRSRHHELRGGEATGVWRLRLAAGGADARSARRVAALVTASVDLAGLPYVLQAGHAPAALDHGGVSGVAGSLLLAAVAQLPRREIPGVRLARRPDFDVVTETVVDQRSITLGAVLDRDERPAGGLPVSRASLNRHTFVCGATGAGKSQTIRHLLTEATTAGLPWLVIEPAKSEYARMATRLHGAGEVVVVRPGAPRQVPVGLNPLVPEPGFPLQTHLDIVRALFVAAFDADEPFPQVLAAALTRCYEQLGWDLALGRPRAVGVTPRYPTLRDLQTAAREVVDDIGYGREVHQNVQGFVQVRLSSLRLGTTGRFLEARHPIDMSRLLGQPTVFEIEDVGDDHDKAFLMGTVLIRLMEHLRVHRADAADLNHLTVVEEAHRLLRRPDRPGPAAQAVEMFAGLLAEVRAYGEGLVIAEQIPAKLLTDVIKNTAVKVVHRLPAQDDRDAVGATMNLSVDQSEYVVTLRPGTAAVFADGMDRPVLARMPDGSAHEATGAGEPAPTTRLVDADRFGDAPVPLPSLEELTLARHVLTDEPRLTLWVELVVAAHLIGRRSPQPSEALRSALRAVALRRTELAIAQAVDDAVETRTASVHGRISPAAFAAHVRFALLRQLADAASDCPPEEWEWLAPAYLPAYALMELNRCHSVDQTQRRHTRSDEWESRLDTPIPGDTIAEQRCVILALTSRWQRRPVPARVTFGHQRPSALERAVGSTVAAPDWTARCQAALTGLARTAQILPFLTDNRS